MAITPVRVSLDRSFESLCDEFRGQLAKKSFYELASVVQALGPWKDLVRDLLEGPVSQVNLHSNPDDPPDVTLVCESTGKTASIEHTDFDNSMHAHARHLHLTALERMTFLPPLYEQEQLSRAETIKLLLNPPQLWDSPMKTIASLACQLEECVDRKLKSFQPKILVVTDKMAFDFKFDVAVMYVVARVQQSDLAIGESTIVFYNQLDTAPTRFASCWVSPKMNCGTEILQDSTLHR
jgi:hypothetical protein